MAEPRGRHDFLGDAHDANGRRTWIVVWLTVAAMIGEIVAGWWTGSMALLADGVHMASDAGALAVAAMAYGYARAHVDNPRYSFGTGKVGDLSGFASALVLGIVAIGIAVESILRLASPTGVAFGPAAIVATLGLVVNVASALLLSGGGHAHHGHVHGHSHDHGHDHGHHHDATGGDNNLRAAHAHVVADALTSLLAIAALLAGRYLGWVWLDPLAGLVGAAVILRWSWTLLRDTASILLDAADPAMLARVRDLVEAPGDVRVIDLHVWRVGPAAHAAIVEVRGAIDRDTVCRRLAPVEGIAHLTVDLV